MRIVMMLFYLVLLFLGVSFAALNAGSVKVNYYFFTMSMPVSVLMTLMLGIGIIFGPLLLLPRYLRLQAELRRHKHQLKLTEQEIKNLRIIPVSDHYTGFGES